MARAKAAEPPRGRNKTAAAEELSRGIEKLRELSAQIDDLSREGFPYRDAVRARTELSLRETIRRIFGEKSSEYQTHKTHKLRTGNKSEAAQSIGLLKELIAKLEIQKAEVLGLKPPSPEESPADDRPLLTAVPPNPSALETLSAPVPGLGPPPNLTTTMPPVSGSPSPTETTTMSAAPAAPAPPPVASLKADLPPTKDQSLNRPIHPAPSVPSVQTEAATAEPKPMDVGTTMAEPAPVQAPLASTIPTAMATVPQSLEPVLAIKSSTIPPIAPQIETVPVTKPIPSAKPLSEPVAPTTPSIPPVSPAPEVSDRTLVLPITPAPATPPSAILPPSKPSAVSSGTDRLSTSGIQPVKADTARLPRPVPAPVPPVQPTPPVTMNTTIMPTRPESPPAPTAQATPPPVTDRQPNPEASPAPAPNFPGDWTESHQLLRRLCARFHLVARQLRLRNEYRPTLEIEDEQDLQDLFYALLRLQFDEVGLEEWSPPYADGMRRTSYLLDRERTVIVVKKTRSGLNARNLAEQIKTDQTHFGGRGEGRTLFCFIYDPEGRVGNPRGLEADLTSISDTLSVEVIVAPK